MIKALEVPLDINLATFSRFLTTRGLPHRVTEEGLKQVIWVAGEREAEVVRAAYGRFESGELDIGDGGVEFEAVRVSMAQRVLSAIWRYPLTIALIVINVVLFPIGMSMNSGEIGELFARMMFVALEQIDGDWYFASLMHTYVEQEQWWRLVTPMLVHFSWLHIVFNLLWVWEVGRRIEMINGAVLLATLVLLSSVTANVTQYLLAGPSLFGGMSGVVFGMLGHSLVWSRLVPSRSTQLPNGIYIFMLAYLAIGFTGAIDLLGLGKLANGAHLGGLIGGLVTGGLAGLLARSRPAGRS